jgi:hypothetical protein
MFPRTSCYVQAIDVERLRLIRQARLAAVAATAAVTVLVFAAISAHATEGGLQDSQPYHACAVVLGLSPSETDYDACAESLSRSLSAAHEAQAVERNRRACAEKGLSVGTSAFDVCVVNAEQSPRASSHTSSTTH